MNKHIFRKMRRSLLADSLPSLKDPFIVYGCIGCKHVKEGMCEVYSHPATWFRYGKVCPFAYESPKETKTKQRIGQQKQKRG